MTTENRRKKLAAKFLVPFIGKRKVDKIRTAITVIGLIAIIVFIGACQLGLEGDTDGSNSKGGSTTSDNLGGGGGITGGQSDELATKRSVAVTYYKYDKAGNFVTTSGVVEEVVFPDDDINKEAEKYAEARVAARSVAGEPDFGNSTGTITTTISNNAKKEYYLNTINAMTDKVNAAVGVQVGLINTDHATYRFVKEIPLYANETDAVNPLLTTAPDSIGWHMGSYADKNVTLLDAKKTLTSNASWNGPNKVARVPSGFKSDDPKSPDYLVLEYSFADITVGPGSLKYAAFIDEWRDFTYHQQLRIAFRYQYQFKGIDSDNTLPATNVLNGPIERQFVTYEKIWAQRYDSNYVFPLYRDPSSQTDYFDGTPLRADIQSLNPSEWFIGNEFPVTNAYGLLLKAIGYPNRTVWISASTGKPVITQYGVVTKDYVLLNELLWRGDLPTDPSQGYITIGVWGV